MLWIADSAQISLQNKNKMITRKSLQNNSSISLELKMMITAKYWNHSHYQHYSCVSLEQWKQENLWIIELALAHSRPSEIRRFAPNKMLHWNALSKFAMSFGNPCFFSFFILCNFTFLLFLKGKSNPFVGWIISEWYK